MQREQMHLLGQASEASYMETFPHNILIQIINNIKQLCESVET